MELFDVLYNVQFCRTRLCVRDSIAWWIRRPPSRNAIKLYPDTQAHSNLLQSTNVLRAPRACPTGELKAKTKWRNISPKGSTRLSNKEEQIHRVTRACVRKPIRCVRRRDGGFALTGARAWPNVYVLSPFKAIRGTLREIRPDLSDRLRIQSSLFALETQISKVSRLSSNSISDLYISHRLR